MLILYYDIIDRELTNYLFSSSSTFSALTTLPVVIMNTITFSKRIYLPLISSKIASVPFAKLEGPSRKNSLPDV
jgi:hypothetical protein